MSDDIACDRCGDDTNMHYRVHITAVQVYPGGRKTEKLNRGYVLCPRCFEIVKAELAPSTIWTVRDDRR